MVLKILVLAAMLWGVMYVGYRYGRNDGYFQARNTYVSAFMTNSATAAEWVRTKFSSEEVEALEAYGYFIIEVMKGDLVDSINTITMEEQNNEE